MKMKNVLILIAAGSLLLLTACASSPKGKGRDFSRRAPLGLVMVVSNQDIGWLGEKNLQDKNTPGGVVRNILGLKKDDEKVRYSTADELVNEADSILRKLITEAEVFRLEDKDRVIGSINSAAAKSKSAKMPADKITADGYRYLNYRDKQFAANFSAETGVKSLLYVTFDFSKEMVSGFMKNGKLRSRVLMEAIVVDASGKFLFRDEFEAFSSEKIEATDGAYSENELMDILKEAIGEVCYRFVMSFRGVTI